MPRQILEYTLLNADLSRKPSIRIGISGLNPHSYYPNPKPATLPTHRYPYPTNPEPYHTHPEPPSPNPTPSTPKTVNLRALNSKAGPPGVGKSSFIEALSKKGVVVE